MVRSNLSQQSVVPLKKGSWSPEEDHKLIAYIQRYGIWNWSQMPKPAGLARSGKSCRLRWVNYLRPDIKRGNFTKDEEEAILRLHLKMGNRWSAIAAALPGRTDNEIKNYWHTNLKKRFKAVQEAKVLSSEKANINKDLSETELFLVDDEALNIMASKLEAAASREMSPPSPQLSRDNLYSSSSGRSTVHDHGNQIAEQQSSINCASDQTFGELQSLWAQSNYSHMVEDHSQSIFTDPIFPCESYNDASSDYWINFYINTSVDI